MDHFVFTPILATSKVPIIILIAGYCKSELPAQSIPPILSTLVELIEGAQDDQSSDIVSVFFPSLKDILSRIDREIRKYFKGSKQANKQVKEVQTYLLKNMWAIDEIDAFYTFLKDSQGLLESKDPKIKRLYPSSFLGRFISSIGIATDVLGFEETMKLWDAFVEYREESRSLIKKTPKKSNFEHLTSKMDIPDTSKGVKVYSQVDLSQLLEFQVHKLQVYAGALPDSLKRILGSLSESQRSIVPSSYYIEYLDCWKNGDYEGSFNALHRYFDYMMSNKQQLFYHYALLSLATLYSSFGADQEALRAVDEAILVARENKDLECLNYLLTWLFDFMKSRPELSSKLSNQTGREQVLQFLKLKTKENKNSVLQSMSYQYESIKQMIEGFPLRKVHNNVTRAFYILLNLDSSVNNKLSFARACQLAVTVWTRVGIPAMAKLYIETALESAGSEISIFDEVELAMRNATILYRSGDADAAFKLMGSYRESVTDEAALMKAWQTRYMLFEADYAMKRGLYNECSVLLPKLEAQSLEVHEYELSCEIKLFKAHYLERVGNAAEAIEVVSDVLSRMQQSEGYYNNYWALEFQLLYVHIMAEHSSSPERALSLLLRSMETARKSSLLLLIVKGTLVLCDLLLKIDPVDSVSDVYQVLHSAMPSVHTVNDLWFTSKAYYLLAKVDPAKSLQYMQKSLDGFQRVADVEWCNRASIN